jgi:hypothetical protein
MHVVGHSRHGWSRAAVAAGADGLIIEVHNNPEKALSDGPQSLYPDQFDRLMGELRATASVGPVRLAASVPAERAISATTWRRRRRRPRAAGARPPS